MHNAEIPLRCGVALRCSQPKQPPRRGKVCQAAFAVAVHEAESALRIVVALRRNELKPMSLGLVVLACGAHGEMAAPRERVGCKHIGHLFQSARVTLLHTVQSSF